jgi:tRNA A37 threonylcarbamoyltransferase TsaD
LLRISTYEKTLAQKNFLKKYSEVTLSLPQMKLATDNALMIAFAGLRAICDAKKKVSQQRFLVLMGA